jgi:hypothetical protein
VRKAVQTTPKNPGTQLAFFPAVLAPPATPALDKLAQLRPDDVKHTPKGPFTTDGKLSEVGRKTLQKRARAKYMTNGITDKLRRLDSELKQSYLNTFFCASILVQDGFKLTGRYCNNRWCLVCNRIRTAKLIVAYGDVLERLPDKHFVTLTIPNVPGADLHAAIRQMGVQIRRIQNQVFRKRGAPIVGVRKLECTYNAIRNDFHPHFHLVVSGAQAAADLVSEWLKTFPEACRAAQDYRPADLRATMELFKYFTKVLTKPRNGKATVYASALDTIFGAMRGLRVFQPMGIRKDIPEDIEEIQAEIYRDLEDRETHWDWVDNDWVDKSTGEVLSDYTPSENLKKLIE